MSHTSQTKGFGLVGVLVVIVVLAVIGGTGVYVYHHEHKAKTTNTSSSEHSSSQARSTSHTTTTDPYSGWSTEALGSTGLSFKYPSTWTVQDMAECDGAHNYTVDAPASEAQQSGLSGISHYGLAVIANAKASETSNCAPSATSLSGIALSSQSQSQLISSGALKGKYVVADGNLNGISGIDVLNATYGPGQKIAETGLLNVSGVALQVTAALASGQNPASANVPSFVGSQLYKDTLNILNSFSTAN